MGSKAKDVGGGPAVPLANDWTSFLKQGLATGQFKGRQQTPADGMMRTDPVGQTQGIGGYINNALSGNLGAKGYTPDISGLQNQIGAGKFNFADFNPQTVDFSKFQNPLQGFNASAPQYAGNEQFQGMLGGLSKIGNMTPQQMMQISQSVGGGGIGGPAPNVSMGGVDISPYQALWDRQRAMGQGDIRARFGASGGAAFGTPAAFAESNYLNENDANRAASLSDIGRQQQALKLQEGQINSGNYNAWQNNLANMAGINSSLFGNLYGTNVNALSSGAGLLSDALGRDASNSLAAQGLNLDALKASGGLNLDALKAASQQGIDVAGLFNQNQGMRAQNQMGAAGMDADILSNILGFQGDAAKFGEGQRQFDVGVGGGVLDQLMNQYGRLADKGISQRQTVMQPSGFQNAISGISGLAGAVAPLITGGFNPMSLFGGGRGATNVYGDAGQKYGGATGGLVTDDGIFPSVQHMAFGGVAGFPMLGGSAGGFASALKQFQGGMQNQNSMPNLQKMMQQFGMQHPAAQPMQRPPLNFGGAPNPSVNPAGGNMSRPMIGAASPLNTLRGFSGGMVNQQAHPMQPMQPPMMGGFGGTGNRRGIFGFAEGGEVPGSSDTVPAMLTPGENVITKHVSDLLGPFAQMLNDLQTPEQIKKVRKAIGDAMGAGLDEQFMGNMQEQMS